MRVILSVLDTRPKLHSDRNITESFVHPYDDLPELTGSIQHYHGDERSTVKVPLTLTSRSASGLVYEVDRASAVQVHKVKVPFANLTEDLCSRHEKLWFAASDLDTKRLL